MHTTATQERTTKYIAAVREHLQRMGHATNADLLEALRGTYPSLSATTVHRITARLLRRKEVQLAPSGEANVLRFDANTEPHDHFMCLNCGLLRDADLDKKVRPLIEESIGDGCAISGRLVVSGLCKLCHQGEYLV
ncbi:transcriptional repressor [Candidatus Saccharibacteria bacterium]|nr:transcriptional repressor [Candidatus Saccharibacteria bacterium]